MIELGPAVLYNGETRDVMRRLVAEGVKVDSVVTDPPYEIGFMGRSWDSKGVAFDPETWRLAWRLLKPGGITLDLFAGSGSTGLGALDEGFRPLLIEEDEHSFNIACGRIAQAVMEANNAA